MTDAALVSIVSALVAAMLGGGGVAWFRLRGENSRIVVDAAQGAVIVQSTVMGELRLMGGDRPPTSSGKCARSGS